MMTRLVLESQKTMKRNSIFQYMHDQNIRRIRIRNSTAVMMPKDQKVWQRLPLEQNPIYGILLLTDLVLAQMGYEDFTIYYEEIPDTNVAFKAMIGIYSQDLGPAIGGVHIEDYKTEEDMIEDVIMVSRSLARKAAICDLGFGGAQVVVDYSKPSQFRHNHQGIFPILEHLGRIAQEYEGRLILAPDKNTTMQNMHIIQRTTQNVICNVNDSSFIPVEDQNEEPGSPNGSGDPSGFTAFSVYQGLKAGFQFLDGNESLRGRKILIIGLGTAGLALVDYLVKEGANLFGADIDEAACKIMEEIYGMTIVARNQEECNQAHSFECEALVPCAGYGLISDKRIKDFRTKMICGSVNYQLNQDRDAVLLHDLGILYIPDFIVNCGGLINASQEVTTLEDGSRQFRVRYEKEDVNRKILEMKDVVLEILNESAREGLSPYEVAIARADLKMHDQRKHRWLRYMAKRS